MASIRARRRRSSAGSRRWPGTGTGRRRRSSGVASEPPVVNGSESGDAWADRVLVSRSYQDDRHRIMATPEASDPLVLRGETATLALLVNADGIGKLPDRFPTIWVTAPTRHEANLGFALNAPFTLDVGRS